MEQFQKDDIYTISPDFVYSSNEDTAVIIPIVDNVASIDNLYQLDSAAKLFCDLLDGNRNNKEIVDAILSEYEVTEAVLMDDLHMFIMEGMNIGFLVKV